MQRIDLLLVEKGFVNSREKARAMIMEGVVTVDGEKVTKAGTTVREDSEIQIKEDILPFVSRGGLKLKKAMECFPIVLQGKTCADIGASTGGFTDCMLQNGAKKVYSIDVGYGQLDWKLRNNPNVIVMERRNARYMEPEWFENVPLDFASIDVSFISLDKILKPLYECLSYNGETVALIKPQFEAGKKEASKNNGVIRDASVHIKVIESVLDYSREAGFSALDLSYSPITGPKGNIEFLLYLKKAESISYLNKDTILSVVEKAHQNL